MRFRTWIPLVLTAVALITGTAAIAEELRLSADAGAQDRPQGSPGRGLSDSPARDRKNSYGFVLGVMGFYDSNMFGEPGFEQGEAAVVFTPRAFANFGSRKSLFHADYQFGYRLFPERSSLNTQSHEAGLEHQYRVSRKTNLILSDHFRFGPNDILSLTMQPLLMPYPGAPGGNLQTFFDRQNMWTNSASTAVSHQWSASNRFDIGAYYRSHRYQGLVLEDTNSMYFRVGDDQRISRRWSLSAEGSSEWVDSMSGSRDGRILRITGGLKFDFLKIWQIAGNAGRERTHLAGLDQDLTTYDTYLRRNSAINRFHIRYSRRSAYQIGLPGLNQTDMADAIFDQRLGAHVSLQFNARYYRMPALDTYGRLETVIMGTGIEYGVHPSLVLSLFGNWFYQKTKVSAAGIPGINADRYVIYAGIYYLYPSVKREARSSRGGGMPGVMDR